MQKKNLVVSSMNQVEASFQELQTRRRSDIKMLVEILIVGLKGAKKTEIVYKANLNFKIAKKYLDFLLAKGLLTEDSLCGRKKIYRTTEKGKMFIKRYGETVELIL